MLNRPHWNMLILRLTGRRKWIPEDSMRHVASEFTFSYKRNKITLAIWVKPFQGEISQNRKKKKIESDVKQRSESRDYFRVIEKKKKRKEKIFSVQLAERTWTLGIDRSRGERGERQRGEWISSANTGIQAVQAQPNFIRQIVKKKKKKEPSPFSIAAD